MNGCDSVVCLSLYVDAGAITHYFATICQGETYSDNNFTDLTEEGVFYDTLASVNGCDSILVLHLTVSGVGIVETGHAPSKIRVYPNPTNDKFLVVFNGITTIKLYDMLGREVLAQTAEGKTEININHLPKGVYSVLIISDDRVIGNSKIVKQ